MFMCLSSNTMLPSVSDDYFICVLDMYGILKVSNQAAEVWYTLDQPYDILCHLCVVCGPATSDSFNLLSIVLLTGAI